jgi:hypothetical protein
MKELKRKFITYFSQSFADVIIIRLKNAETEDEFDFWFDMGAKLDAYCVNFHEIYLN